MTDDNNQPQPRICSACGQTLPTGVEPCSTIGMRDPCPYRSTIGGVQQPQDQVEDDESW